MNLYTPPDYCNSTNSLIFLAGPIQGAPRWQNEVIKFFANYPINIASPRYIGKNEEMIGDWTPNITFQQQIDWELYHLNLAGEKGVILFWLSNESKHLCKYPFAQTSRFELGEWKERHLSRSSKLVVGIENNFPGSVYIEHRLSKECPKIPIEKSLTLTCEKALELISISH